MVRILASWDEKRGLPRQALRNELPTAAADTVLKLCRFVISSRPSSQFSEVTRHRRRKISQFHKTIAELLCWRLKPGRRKCFVLNRYSPLAREFEHGSAADWTQASA